jgi:hypothetical protein
VTTLRALACLTVALCTVLALLRLEGLPPDEADALWRDAMDSAFWVFSAPGE